MKNCKCVTVDLIETDHGSESLVETYECSKCGKKTIYEYDLVDCYDVEVAK